MRYIFRYYNHSAFGLNSFFTYIEVKADNYENAWGKVKKLLPLKDADGQKITNVGLSLILLNDNPFSPPN